jgi:hypothetical protein
MITGSESRLDVEIVGEGRNLVLLHSLLSDRTSYEPLAPGRRRAPLILVNLPGVRAVAIAGPSLAPIPSIAAMS